MVTIIPAEKNADVNVWFYVLNLLCMDVQTK